MTSYHASGVGLVLKSTIMTHLHYPGTGCDSHSCTRNHTAFGRKKNVRSEANDAMTLDERPITRRNASIEESLTAGALQSTMLAVSRLHPLAPPRDPSAPRYVATHCPIASAFLVLPSPFVFPFTHAVLTTEGLSSAPTSACGGPSLDLDPIPATSTSASSFFFTSGNGLRMLSIEPHQVENFPYHSTVLASPSSNDTCCCQPNCLNLEPSTAYRLSLKGRSLVC